MLVPAEKRQEDRAELKRPQPDFPAELDPECTGLCGIIPDDRHLSHIVRPGQDDHIASSSDDLQNRRLVPVAGADAVPSAMLRTVAEWRYASASGVERFVERRAG
jgi:hypothetical protein